MSVMSWIPLESNPDVMNSFIDNLGVGDDWKFVDVWGFEDELLQYIPRPVVALILLFPVEDKEPEKTDKKHESSEEITGDQPIVNDGKVYFIKQTIQNACGAIAILHAIANNTDKITFKEGSTLKNFIDKTKNLSPDERAEVLLTSSPEISNTHSDCAQAGQTQAPEATASVDLHFIALVNVDGTIYELDGRKPGPVSHGSTTSSTFLEDACKVCPKFMKKSPNCLRFTVVALVKHS